MTFKGHFAEGFKDRDLVNETISHWNLNHQHFTLRTSGSTGLPRDIQLSRDLLEWSADHTCNHLNLTNEHFFCCLPVEKTGGFMQLIRALRFGWEITFVEPSSNPMQDVDTSEFTVVSLTPTQAQNILEDCPEKLSGFKHIILGGAHVYDSLSEAIQKYKLDYPDVVFWESYGMTETASNIAMKNLSNNENFFTPYAGVEITTVQGHLAVIIRDVDLKLETTDLAVIKGNKFKIMGRMDDVINSGGIKIHPAILEPKIKNILAGLKIFRNLYITKKDDHDLGEKAVLVLEGSPIKDTHFILEILKRELPQYKAPKEIEFADKVHFTNTGKVIRKAVE